MLWLLAAERERFTAAGVDLIESGDLVISPIVEVELALLKEIGRTEFTPERAIATLGAQIGLTRSDTPFASIAATAVSMSWARDPFDRLIVADASASGATLLTKDRQILQHFDRAVW